ncbi:MAG: hypothetical protein WCC27_10660 [Acidobacteriaceae bacterium]
MKVIAVEKLEDCFDGSIVCCYRFDEAWSRSSIEQLAGLGTLEYFADFPRPFFRVRGAGSLEIKGVEGARHCRVLLRSDEQGILRDSLDECLRIGASG